jgi:hypothetical protein
MSCPPPASNSSERRQSCDVKGMRGMADHHLLPNIPGKRAKNVTKRIIGVSRHPYRFLTALRSSTDGYPRFLSAESIPCIMMSWILQRSLKAASRNASCTARSGTCWQRLAGRVSCRTAWPAFVHWPASNRGRQIRRQARGYTIGGNGFRPR